MHSVLPNNASSLWPFSVKLVIAMLLAQCHIAFPQSSNLVVNPSFEEKIDFQGGTNDQNWSRCLKNDTPDYIEFTTRGEPEFYYRKYIGGLLPYDGEAYVGIFCYRTNPLRGVENVREFIQAPLKASLEKDSIYLVSLYIALDPESTSAINNFNVCFWGEPVFFKKEKQMFELLPQIRFRGSTLDSISWIRLESTYKAKGNETQIILGNFLTDASIRKKSVSYKSEMMAKWNLHELERAAYYYIDKVSVLKTSGSAQLEEKAEEAPELKVDLQLIPDLVPDTSLIEIDEVDHNTSIVLNNIFFEFDESNLLPASYYELDRLNNQLSLFKDLSIVIEGHTDNMGTYEYNIRLSLNRARAVVDYLVDKGLERERIRFEGYGYTRPLSDNRTEAGRKMNRRVAFRIT